jgi:hypothetical protein
MKIRWLVILKAVSQHLAMFSIELLTSRVGETDICSTEPPSGSASYAFSTRPEVQQRHADMDLRWK